MEWKKYEEVKDSFALGDIILGAFKAPKGVSRIICLLVVGHDGRLINMHKQDEDKYIDIEPDYVIALTTPDQFPIVYVL